MRVERIQPNSATGLQRDLAGLVCMHPDIPDGASWEQVHDIMCREVARGQIVARYDEVAAFRPTKAYVVARPGGSGVVIVDTGGTCLSVYLLGTLRAAHDTARGIIGSGQAWNW